MKTKKITKKIENHILKKKVKSFNSFTLEYCSNTKSFFKKNKNVIYNLNGNILKHPLRFHGFNTFNNLKCYLTNKNSRIIFIGINNIFIKQHVINNLYLDNNQNIKKLFMCLKKLYVLWRFI